jgi:hypothetical protein
MEVADQWPHRASLDQPAPAPRLLLATRLVHQVIEVMRAPDGDHRSQRAEFARADACGQIQVGQDLHALRQARRAYCLVKVKSQMRAWPLL